MMIFVGDRFVVTVRKGEAQPAGRGARPAGGTRRSSWRHGPIAVMYSVMDSIVDNYTAIDAELMRGPRRDRAPRVLR